MIEFPKSTKIIKNIPKTSFYEKADMTSAIRKKFVEYITSIYLVNKLSRDTLNIKPTKNVEEIFVFNVKLKSKKYLEKIEDVLLVIDKSILYPILLIISVDDKEVMYKIAYKERNKIDDNKSVIDIYLSLKQLNLKGNLFNSLNLEVLYERLLRLFLDRYEKLDIAEAIDKYKYFKSLGRELEKLENKVVKEKQADRQYGIYEEIKRIKKELKQL